jgi:hypothetical protein
MEPGHKGRCLQNEYEIIAQRECAALFCLTACIHPAVVVMQRAFHCLLSLRFFMPSEYSAGVNKAIEQVYCL